MTPEIEALNIRTRDRLRQAREALERILSEGVIVDTADRVQAAIDVIMIADRKLCKPDESSKNQG